MPHALPPPCQLHTDRCILNKKRERWSFFNFLEGGDILATKRTCLSQGVGNLNDKCEKVRINWFFNTFCPIIHINCSKKKNIEEWTFMDSQ